MKKHRVLLSIFVAVVSITLIPLKALTQDTVPVHLVVTAETTNDSVSLADIDKSAVIVKQGKDRLQVSEWIPARDKQAALQLFILIDEASNSTLGSHLNDLKEFINAQAATTSVAVGYMRNADVTIITNFTTDHAQAANSLRLPMMTISTMDSPYLSLVSLLKRWPVSKARREVVMITSGIDKVHGNSPMTGGASMSRPTPYISTDVNTASDISQRVGVIVHTIYAPGVTRADRNYFEANNGLNSLSKLSDETGGESFSLAARDAVSFKPYCDRLQTILSNQYFLVFQAKPQKKAGLQRIKLDTSVPNVEIAAPDNVWVPAQAAAAKK